MTSRLGEGWHRLDARVLRLDVLAEAQVLELLARIVTQDLAPAVLAGDDVPAGLDGCLMAPENLTCTSPYTARLEAGTDSTLAASATARPTRTSPGTGQSAAAAATVCRCRHSRRPAGSYRPG